MKALTELQKVQLLESTVLSGTIQEVHNVLETYAPFEFTARALGFAARSRGLVFVEELVRYGATFRYRSTSSLNRRYGMYTKGGTSSGVHYSQYDLLLVADLRGLPVFSCWQQSTQVLPLEERLAIVRYLAAHPELGVSLDQLLFYALITGELDFADALIDMGIRLQDMPPSYYTPYICDAWWNYNHTTYLEIITQGIQSIYWSAYVDALAAKAEEALLPILKRFHQIADASGKKLVLTKGAFSQLKWNDASLLFALEHMDLSKINQSLILETAVLKAAGAALTMIANQGWITKADKIEKLIKLALENNRTEALSWLLDYKNQTVDIAAEAEKMEAKMKRQLAESPNSVAAMKKLWTFTKLEDGTIRIEGYKGTEIDVIVPAMIGKSAVTAIDEYAFNPHAPRLKTEQADARKAIRSVEFLAEIRELPERLFSNGFGDAHAALERVILPESLEVIGENCFYGCRGLKEITLPQSVKEIASWAFHSCASLKEMTIPEGVKEIGSDAFSGCKKLKMIHLPHSMTKLPAFGQCGFKEFVVPHHIKELSYGCFSYCSSLRRVVLHDGIQIIPDRCFDNTALESIELPSSITSIGNEAFAYCKNLRHFNIPETVTDIGEDAFAYCPQFQNEQGLVLIRGVMHSYNGKSSDKLCLDQSINRVSQEALQNLPDIIYREGTVREYSLPDISVLQVGETVMLGRCIQDLTLEMKPIAWRVIAEEDGKKLLLADKGLIKVNSGMGGEAPNWERCHLRKRVCRNFMQIAFDEEERSHIQPIVLSNKGRKELEIPDSGDTQEMVFLLSLDELEKYLPESHMRVSQYTEYVAMQLKGYSSVERRMYWPLRTRGKKKNIVQLCVSYSYGGLRKYVQSIDFVVFRPAMWVK